MNLSSVSGWDYPLLGEICDVRDGTHDSPKYIEDGYPLITSKNLTDDGLSFTNVSFISKADHDAIEKRSAVSNGDILYGMIGTIGNPVIVIKDREFSVKNVAIFKFKEESLVLNKYLLYVLNSDYISRQIAKERKGGTQSFVSLKVLRGLKVPLPPLAIQKQIAAVLEKADQLRKDCQQMEQELNSLAQSVFIYMFGDPVTNPKGWKVRPLESLIVKGDRINYGVVQPGQFETVDTGVPLIRISDFSKGKISLDKIKFIGAHVDAKYKRSKIIGDEVLIACVGATIGKTAIVTEKHKGYNIARAVTRVRVDGTINRYFLQKYLESDFVQSFFIQETRSVGQPTLNTSLIAKTPILIPDGNTQNLFLKFSEQNDEQIINAINLAEKYELQFNALMQQAFNGELNLTDAPH